MNPDFRPPFLCRKRGAFISDIDNHFYICIIKENKILNRYHTGVMEELIYGHY
jgi:hypothetical protein